MKGILNVAALSVVYFLVLGCDSKKEEDKPLLQNGDIIFTRLNIPQVKNLKYLSKADYAHAGIVFFQEDSLVIFEAGGSVDLVSFDRWMHRNKVDSSFVIKRLKKEYQKDQYYKALINEGRKYKGRYTDIFFDWSDSMMYGPELVWKMYKRGLGVALCPTKKMKDWDHSNKRVEMRLKQKYDYDVPFSLEDTVVSVDDIFDSDKLELVFSGKKEELPKSIKF